MCFPNRFLLSIVIVCINLASIQADDVFEHLNEQFKGTVRPLIHSYCAECHDDQTSEAELDLEQFQDVSDIVKSHPVWETVLERLVVGDMPPDDAIKRPTNDERKLMIDWLTRLREREAKRNAGDPGTVIARRLSNAEFDYSIRDLTGVDIKPTKTFPVDPANEAGFDNSGESLTMSPALMSKYLEATRMVTDHMLLTPHGIAFAPHPVVTETDRDKHCVKEIVEFYQRQPTDLADYFLAAWKFRSRKELGNPNASLDEIAIENGISVKYLNTVWEILVQPEPRGPLEMVHSRWEAISPSENIENATERCKQLRNDVNEVRKLFEPSFDDLEIDGGHKGSQPVVLWKNKKYASARQIAEFSFLGNDDVKSKVGDRFKLPDDTNSEKFKADCERFCSIFPDAFYVSERGRDYLGKSRNEQEKGRLLSAGFHSMMGYFRDDQPLMELVLDDLGKQELNSLWEQLLLVSTTPQRQYQGFLWFEKAETSFMRGPEFDFARSEDKNALSSEMIERLAEAYLNKAINAGADEVALQAVRDFFLEINDQIRWVERAQVTSQPYHLEAVVNLASRAFRKPLTANEQQEIRDFYQQRVENDGLSHLEAIQDAVVSILMSPQFCYRVDLLCTSEKARPLDDYELASRLSYFLWSSIPDEELLTHAAAGDLHQVDVLKTQTKRMLKDDRVAALAIEFAGNWLDVRRFEEHNAVDRGRFKSFDDRLRQAMFQEPVRFFIDVVQNDQSVLDFLYANHTFVNKELAAHYGMEELKLDDSDWKRVDDADRFGRGSLLPMAVFLTKNAPGLRTSPVKRGYWVARRLLGERIPPPPPNVPEIPGDESKLGELTLRETLAKHRDHASCAGCHNRIDSIGLSFEGFGPIGERREVDLAGREIDDNAVFPDGSKGSGVEGLRRYVKEKRETDFIDNLCRKLLSYALGRSLQLSDEELLRTMRLQLQNDEYRFGSLVNSIVISPPFLNKLGRELSNTELTSKEGSNE